MEQQNKIMMDNTTRQNNSEQRAEALAIMDYAMIADMFLYPESEAFKEKIREIYIYLSKEIPEAAAAMQPFMDFMEVTSFQGIQELFLRSFDLQAITTLDIGFVLFGEDYKRGKLLVHLNEEHRNAGNDCHSELSDHLPNILNLLPKMKDENMRNEIATRLVMPAVEKMIKEFSIEKIDKKDVIYKKHLKVILEYPEGYRTVYQSLLHTLFIVLKKDFEYVSEDYEEMRKNAGSTDASQSFLSPKQVIEDKSEKDFVQNIETEMLTEKE